MPDELVTVSAAHVLTQISDSLRKAQKQLENTLNEIGSFLRPSSAGSPSPDAPLQNFVLGRQAELLGLRGDIQSALGAVGMLDVISPRPTDSRAPADDIADVKPSERDMTVIVAGVSATTVHRMSEIGESLKLSRQQTLERCVATQNYVDAKLRERWQFFIKRGRERRAVSFPGQNTV
jgi:hypothetical protein